VRRTTSLIISLIALAGLISACGDDDTTESGLGSSADSTADDDGGHDMDDDGMDDGHMDDGHMDDGHMDDEGREHAANTPAAPGARSIELSGSSYAFDPREITVRAGEEVAIVLTATDIEHDFTVDGLDSHVSADAGETAEGGLRADEPGSYTYYCSVEGHREAGMEGTLIVEPA
jgi:plastocyanin/predicted small secreted protein